MLNLYIYIIIYVGRGVFNLAPASSPLSLGPIQGLGAGDAGGAFAPPLNPPLAAAYCACCAVLLLRLPTAVLLSCYSYPQNLRRDGVEFILRVGLTTSRARERRGNIYIYISCLYISLYVYTYAFK
jgi:hypothetical protein